MSQYPIIETVGIEFESLYTHEGSPPINGVTNYIRSSHDASIQTDAIKMGRREAYLVVSNTELLSKISTIYQRTVIGNELVTIPIYERNKLDKVIKIVTRNLFDSGETTRGKRESLHIHICYSYNLEILKRIMEVSLVIENFMFNIGGCGYKFRGLTNNSIYCRPFSKYGPPVVYNDNKFVQILEVDNLFNSKSIDEFWACYGGLSIGHNNRYHPSRYFYINLYSLLIHGTLEFRVFNKTLDYNRVCALVDLCQCIGSIILDEHNYNELVSLGRRSIFTYTDKDNNLKMLDLLSKLYSFKKTTLKVLRDMITMTPEFKLESNYVYTHVNRFLESDNTIIPSSVHKTVLQTKDIVETTIEDIHTLRNNGRRPQRINSALNWRPQIYTTTSSTDDALYEERPDIGEEDNEPDNDDEILGRVGELDLSFFTDEQRNRMYLDNNDMLRIREE